jgi:transposase-like protein
MTKTDASKYFHRSHEIIRLTVIMYVRFPLLLRNVEDLLHERRINISHETVRYWWNRFGPMFAAEIRRKRVQKMRAYSNWKWHPDEVFVRIDSGWQDWSCQAYVPVSQLIYAAFRSNAKGLLPPKHECLRRGL